MNGLSTINIELTSRCNKDCWMCGRRKMEREWPELLDWGDMPLDMVWDISRQVPSGIVVQFHWNGEPLLYPQLDQALDLFKNNIRCLDTNAKLIYERADEIIGNLETVTVSVIEKDPEAESQFKEVCKFLEKKGNDNPWMVYRLLGDVENPERWEALPGIVARRILHRPEGSFGYEKTPTIPETGICQDLLSHLAIDRYGNVSCCVRFDPHGKGRLGNIQTNFLSDIWNGKKRKNILDNHVRGRRDLVPLCSECDYWGCPTGP